MIRHDLTRFLEDSVVVEEDTDDGLGLETLYGLYISWCHLQGETPAPEGPFRDALHRQGLQLCEDDPGSYAGVKMIGPAARDFALNNEPCDLPEPHELAGD